MRPGWLLGPEQHDGRRSEETGPPVTPSTRDMAPPSRASPDQRQQALAIVSRQSLRALAPGGPSARLRLHLHGAVTLGTFYFATNVHAEGLTGDCFGGVNGTLDGTSVFPATAWWRRAASGIFTEPRKTRCGSCMRTASRSWAARSTAPRCAKRARAPAYRLYDTHVDSGTTDAADGRVLGTETLHAT